MFVIRRKLVLLFLAVCILVLLILYTTYTYFVCWKTLYIYLLLFLRFLRFAIYCCMKKLLERKNHKFQYYIDKNCLYFEFCRILLTDKARLISDYKFSFSNIKSVCEGFATEDFAIRASKIENRQELRVIHN